MDKLEEVLIRINERIILNEKLKKVEGDIIGVNVEDIKLILKELKDTKVSLNASNSIMINLLDVIKIKDRMINEMAEFLIGFPVFNYNGELETTLKDKEDVIKYFEERCKNAKD